MKFISRYLFFLLPCIFAIHAVAQTTFVRMYNRGNMGYAVREINGNNYVVGGGTDYYFNWHWMMNSNIATTNIHLYKTDNNGILQWERILSKLNTRLIAKWMEPTLDGGYILTGSANSDVVWPPDSNDIVLVKTDANGIAQWSKIYDSGKDELGFCVQQTTDSGYIISGFHDAMPVSLMLNTYIILIKTDATGTVQWEKKYQFAVRDFNTHEPFSYVVKQTANGGFIVTGTTSVTHPADLNVLRTDAAGNLLWANSYQHDSSMFRNSLGLDVIENTTGDFIIAGSMDKESPQKLNYPYYLKLSSTGSLIKQRFFETLPVLNFQSGLSSVQQTTDGGYFFTGMGGYNDFGMQAQLLKTDSNLDMQWSRVYTMDGNATVGAMSGRETSDGGYVFTGLRQFSGSILMKSDSAGLVPCKIPNSLIEDTPSVTIQNWTPAIISGINTSSALLNVTSPMADTTVLCPIILSHLPVSFNYFTAQPITGLSVKVEWQTASENNCDYFIVEKSADGKTFSETGKITGHGNSNNTNNYSYIDEKPYPVQVSYYRLRQVDFNGSGFYTKTVTVKSPMIISESIVAFVDHNNHQLVISINNISSEVVEYAISDAIGKINYVGRKQVNKGADVITVDLNNYSSGIYFVSVNAGNSKSVNKFLY